MDLGKFSGIHLACAQRRGHLSIQWARRPVRLFRVSLTDQALLEVVPLLLSEIFLLARVLAGHHQQRPDVVFLADSLFHAEKLLETFLRIAPGHWLTADAVLRTLVDFVDAAQFDPFCIRH